MTEISTSAEKRKKRNSPPSHGVFVAIGLGANEGDAAANLRSAIGALQRWLSPLAVSPLYRSPALSPIPQDAIPQEDYLNLVATGSTRRPAEDLLAQLKALEWRAGRRRGERFGPRLLDLDLLLYAETVSAEPALTLPHPRLRERRFVLAPLADLAPRLALPPDGAMVEEVLAGLGPEGGEAWRVPWPDGEPPRGTAD